MCRESNLIQNQILNDLDVGLRVLFPGPQMAGYCRRLLAKNHQHSQREGCSRWHVLHVHPCRYFFHVHLLAYLASLLL